MIKTNMSIPNCNFDKYNNSLKPRVFNVSTEPLGREGYIMLNENVISDNYDKAFNEVECNYNCGNKKVYFANNDPKLISVPLAQGLFLDTPPINHGVQLKNVYNLEMNNYSPKIYNDYSDISNGQIMYYIDKSIADPFIEPIFENPSEVSGYIYKDAMDGIKPYYERTPLTYTDVYNVKKYTPNTLTSIRDSGEFREDLMSKQMDLQNKKKYSARWY